MKEFENKVAVVTGAASGIGLGLARKAASLGMRLVISDIDSGPLGEVRGQLESLGSKGVIAVTCDVSDAAQMAHLASRTREAFGAAHLLFNNAGVGAGGAPLWEMESSELDWVLGVNLHGVVHGLQQFVPMMLEQGEGHVVNTASIAGLMSAPNTGAYTISKHAVVAMSEMLHGELQATGKDVGVSVLCPSFVDTMIYTSERHRPMDEARKYDPERIAEREAIETMAAEFFKSGAMPADDVAEQVFDAIRCRRFYILTHPKGSREQIGLRMRAILEDGQPSATGPENFPLD